MKEKQDIELKSIWKDEYLKVIAGFANSEGGKLYIGIDDKGKIAGVTKSKKLLEDIPNKIKNKLLIVPFVYNENREGKEIICIDVLPANFPVFCDGKIYVRSGSTIQELSGIELSSFLLNKTGQTWDSLPTDAQINDLDIESIEIFKKLAKDRLPLISQETNIEKLIENLKLFTKDKKLTRAATLLFGKEPQRYFITAYTKIGRFRSDTEIIDTVIAEGNLFQQLDITMNAIKKHLNVKFDTTVNGTDIDSLSRKDIWDYPLEALREAIINALIHKDYIDTSPIQIKIFDDKIVFWNSGKLMPPLTVEKLKGPHTAKQRNPLIASIFYYAGLIEAWGSGTTKMVNMCINQKLPEPEFIESKEGIGDFTVIFNKDIYTEEYLEKLGLNERQIRAVMFVKEKKKITNKDYQNLNKISRQMATIELKELVDKNIFVTTGKAGRGIAYQLTKLPNN